MIYIKRRGNIFLVVIFFISLFFTTIVYSAFNTQLQIKGDAIVRREQMFRITGLRLLDATNGAYEAYNSKYEKDSTSLYIMLPATSKMIYEVTISNKNRELIYSLLEILPLVSNNSNVKVEYSINVGDFVNSNEDKIFTITITNNTSTEQSLNLITQYRFEPSNWTPLETNFLSLSDTGDLSLNEEGVIFEVSITNPNAFSVNYMLSSDNYRFIVIDDTTNNDTFQIDASTTKTHQIRVKLRDDVVSEKYTENLKLLVNTTSPLSSTTDIKTVVLTLPRNFNTIILNTLPIEQSPQNFTTMEDTNGYLLKIKDESSSHYTYYYRGVINNNYFQFADFLWRIVRIEANGNIKLVLNDNVSATSQYTKNYVSGFVENLEAGISLVDYKNSNVRRDVEAWYSQNIDAKDARKYVVKSKFCVDLSYQDPFETQYENTVYYFAPYLHVGVDAQNFTPDFNCSDENVFLSYVGLLSAEEVLAAGGYWDNSNKNYYLYNPDKSDNDQTSWTLSASYYSIYEKQAGVIVFNQEGRGLFDWVLGGNLSEHYGYRPVISISGNYKVSGTGTIDDPYQIIE